MILLLGFVDLIDRIANSIWVQPVAILESSEPSSRAHPECSYIPLSQCKLQAVRVVENDCMWPCLVKLQAFLLSELQIAQKYCILKAFLSILVWLDPWFRKIAWSFPHVKNVFHRIHCSACLPLLKLVPPGINPIPIKELNSSAFPIARRNRNWLEEFGFTQYWNLFFAPPPFARVDIQSSSDHCETSLNFFFLHYSMMSL